VGLAGECGGRGQAGAFQEGNQWLWYEGAQPAQGAAVGRTRSGPQVPSPRPLEEVRSLMGERGAGQDGMFKGLWGLQA